MSYHFLLDLALILLSTKILGLIAQKFQMPQVVGALIAVMQRLGWSWLQSLSVAAALSLAVTAVAAWRTIHYFDRAGLHATRRQLSRLGIGDEGDDAEEEKPGAAP